MKCQSRRRKGATIVMICFLLVPLLGLLAFSVDYGFLLYVRTDLQRAADNACLAGVRDLIPDNYGEQDLAAVRATVRNYLEANLGEGFEIDDTDIEIGRFNPDTAYDDNEIDLLNDGIFDTVRISVRRSDLANNSIVLYFAQLFGQQEAAVSVTSAAILQKGRYLDPGTDVLPIAIEESVWNQLERGDEVVVYGDGKLTYGDDGDVPGNWGTLDIGAQSNSTSDLVRQITQGLSQDDLDALYSDGRIAQSTHIDSQVVIDLNGDTGFSAGIKQGIDEEIGNTKVMPIYSSYVGQGGNLEFKLSGWGAVRIESARWKGGKKSEVVISKSYLFDKDIRPNPDLTDDDNVLEAIYTSPVLAE